MSEEKVRAPKAEMLKASLERIANLENEVNDLREQNGELRSQIRNVRYIIQEMEKEFNYAIHDIEREIGLDND